MSPFLSRARLRALYVTAVLAAGGFLAPAAPAAADALGNYWVTNGPVYTSALSGTTLYLGGDFSFVGPQTGAATLVNLASAQPGQFPLVNGSVTAAVPDGNGGLYIGGRFTQAGQTAVTDLAHIVTDGSGALAVDAAFTPAVGGSGAGVGVDALALSGSTLYVGGSFDSVGGSARHNLAAIDTGAGTVAAGWDPAPDGAVHALYVAGANLLVGGEFANIGGAARNGVAAVDLAGGTAVTGWDAGAGPGAVVRAITADQGGTFLYLGGTFSTIGGQPRSNIAKLALADASLVTAWDPGANDSVYDLRLDSSARALYVAGAFNTITEPGPSLGGADRDYLAKLDALTGAVDTAWKPRADGPVYSLDLDGGNLYVGGAFTAISGAARRNIAAIGLSAGTPTTWDAGAGDAVRVTRLISLAGAQQLFAGGDFNSVGGKVRLGAAAINTGTGAATEWDPQANGIVRAIAPSAGSVFIGGDFTAVGSHSRNYFAALDGNSGQALAEWDINFDGRVDSLLLSGTTLYAGGEFTQVGGAVRRRLAAFDTQAVALTAWAPVVDDGAVWSLAQYTDEGATVYFGGTFSSVGGVQRHHLAAADAGTGALQAWNPDVTGNAVYSLAMGPAPSDTDTGSDDSGDAFPALYVGGDFTQIAGAPRRSVAAVSTGDAATLVSWDANGDTADGPVYRLLLSGDHTLLYAAGRFTSIGGQGHAALAALTTADGDATAWDPQPGGGGAGVEWDPQAAPGGADTWVGALAMSGSGRFFFGGNFRTLAGVIQHYVAALQAPVSRATPRGGAYPSARSVTLACTDQAGAPCDQIFYSTDGSVPSVLYGGQQLSVGTNQTVRYFGVSQGMREDTNADNYVIDGTPPTVTATPTGGTYTAQKNIVLTCSDTGDSGDPLGTDAAGCAAIYYTTDGSVPTSASSAYGAPVALSDNTDLKFVAYDAAGNRSAVGEQTYTIDSLAPTTTPSPAAGTYSTPQTVTLSCNDGSTGSGCDSTYYTLDGSVPNLGSARYTGPLLIDHNTTLNYFSTDKASHQEGAHTAVYLIQTGQVVTSGGGAVAPAALPALAALALLGARRRRRR